MLLNANAGHTKNLKALVLEHMGSANARDGRWFFEPVK